MVSPLFPASSGHGTPANLVHMELTSLTFYDMLFQPGGMARVRAVYAFD